MKFLILFVAMVVLVGMLGASIRRLTGGDKKKRPKEPPPSGSKSIQEMRACAHCGVHLPLPDMVMDGENAYCSPAHRNAGPAPGSS
jgi:uncharacterized protein